MRMECLAERDFEGGVCRSALACEVCREKVHELLYPMSHTLYKLRITSNIAVIQISLMTSISAVISHISYTVLCWMT